MPVPSTGIVFLTLATPSITNGISGCSYNFMNVVWPIVKILPLTGAQIAKQF